MDKNARAVFQEMREGRDDESLDELEDEGGMEAIEYLEKAA